MHLLPLEHIDEFHLLFEGLQQLVPLPFELSVLVSQSVLVPAGALAAPGFVHFRLPQGEFELLNFFQSAVQLRIFISLLLGLLSFLALLDINLFVRL